ncbi:MAG: Uma2 family endonuclease [Bacteroidota bacterium]
MFTVYDTDNDDYSKVEEPDPSLTYTYADYLKWNFEERLELFRGKIFRLSAPNTKHQVIAGNIFVLVKSFLSKQKCQAFIAPFDVRLPAKNRKKDNEVTTVVQPDICVVCDESKIDSRGCCGAPDLIVEILSPGNTKKEIKLKYELYEEAGVSEYWVVYPEEESVVVFALNEQRKYSPAVFYAGDDTIQAVSVPGFTVKMNDIFTK